MCCISVPRSYFLFLFCYTYPMKFLKSGFIWILLLGAVALWVYADINKTNACAKSIEYTIGSFDTRFNISKADFVATVKQAEAIWEDATGKDLFTYDAEPTHGRLYDLVGHYFVRGEVAVNLIYDERQAKSEEHRALSSEIDTKKESADAVKFQFENLQAQYKAASASYQQFIQQYRARKISYETLEEKRLEVNRLAQEVNALIKKYNLLVGQINTVVREVNQNAGQEFEEGQYIRDEKGERITIYEFGTRQDLLRVLAHEFGHALGLDARVWHGLGCGRHIPAPCRPCGTEG